MNAIPSPRSWVLVAGAGLVALGAMAGAEISPSEASHNAGAQESTSVTAFNFPVQIGNVSSDVSLRMPVGWVHSGLEPTFHLELMAFALMPASDAAARIAPAISVSSASRALVPVQITGVLDGNGMTRLDLAAMAAQAKDNWYQVTILTIPGVTLEGEESTWTLRLYTGDMIYVERLIQPLDPAKADSVILRFSQTVDFDASWASRMLTDADGQNLAGCAHINGDCVTSGRLSLREVQVRLAKGGGRRLAKLAPVDAETTTATDAVSAQMAGSRRAAPIALSFRSCEHDSARCAWF